MKKLKELAKLIEQGNLEFEGMSKADKRVQIAEDCLKRIALQQIYAVNLTTCYIRNQDDELSIKEVLNSEQVVCKVCAKGGLFISYIGRVNQMTFGEIENDADHDSNEMKKLLEIFTERQLTLIEYAFEGSQIIDYNLKGVDLNFSKELRIKAEKFKKQFNSAEDTLKAICDNIIENKGTFKL